MRIITRKRLREYAARYTDAAVTLQAWAKAVQAARWRNLDEVRMTYPHADNVRVYSGGEATVFNIKGNHYRLITAIHYDRQRVFIMRFLTHAEYNKDRWKETL
jgi:mRNA interferase HigB